MCEVIFILVLSMVTVFASKTLHFKPSNGCEKANNYCNIPAEIYELMLLDVPGLISRFGYPIEVHHVTTPDGYILEMHRIPHGKKNFTRSGKNSVVFIMHGLLGNSADFVVLGPGVALSLLLADEGYDVWLGNARGNFYSRNHIKLNPDTNSSFWRFSWDEIGNIDLPTSIDYILHLTAEMNLHFIGHSQGGTTFLVMNSLRPEYNKKIKSFHGLAPSSYNTYTPYTALKFLAKMLPLVDKMVELLGPFEFLNNIQSHTLVSNLLCGGNSVNDPACLNIIQTVWSETANINTTLLPLSFSKSPAGSSIMQALHYGQSIRLDTFARYNFNSVANLEKYGSINPPAYELNKVTAKTFLYCGLNDHLVYWKDLKKLSKELPNLQELFIVKMKNFNHLDFIFRSDVKNLLYDKVIENIRKMY